MNTKGAAPRNDQEGNRARRVGKAHMQTQWTMVTDDGGGVSSTGHHDTVEEVMAEIAELEGSGYVFTWVDSRSGTVFEPSSGSRVAFSIEWTADPK